MITNKNFAWLSSITLIKISGPEAQKYLQGQLTIDLEKIPENTAQLAAHCNAQGRMVSLGYVLKKEDSYFYLVPQETAESALKHLKKFVLRSKVNFEILNTHSDTSLNQPDFKIFGLWGDLGPLIAWSDIVFKIDKNRLLIIAPKPHITHIENDILKTGFTLRSENHWLKNQIENKTAWLDQHTQEKFLPDEIKLADQNGVCLTKGCFIGQEIIARMHYLAQSKNLLKMGEMESMTGKIICQVSLDQKNYALSCDKN